MRTNKELILATKPFASEKKALSWWYVISTCILLIASLLGTYWNLNLYGNIACSILSGLLLVRMFGLYHDFLHHAILFQSMPAKIIMKIYGIYILAPSSIWKRSHDFHHKHNSKLNVTDIGAFPTATKKDFLTYTKKEKTVYLAIRHPLNILFGYLTIFMYSFCINSILNSTKKHLDCGLALILHFAFGGLLFYFGGFQALLLTLIIPHLIACGLGSYLFYVQHNFIGAEFNPDHNWDYTEAAIRSTSFFKMNFIMNYFTCDIGYHHVHHLNSRIPFYRLREALKSFPELNATKTTTFNPIEMYRCLQLKIWDEEKGKMIGLTELYKK